MAQQKLKGLKLASQKLAWINENKSELMKTYVLEHDFDFSVYCAEQADMFLLEQEYKLEDEE